MSSRASPSLIRNNNFDQSDKGLGMGDSGFAGMRKEEKREIGNRDAGVSAGVLSTKAKATIVPIQ